MKKILNRTAKFVEDHKVAILTTELVLASAFIVVPKVREAIVNYKQLQSDASETKLALYALAGRVLDGQEQILELLQPEGEIKPDTVS